MGWNSQPTRMVIMEDVRIPAANVLGGVNDGFKIAMAGLNGGENRATLNRAPLYARLLDVFETPYYNALHPNYPFLVATGRINIASCSVGGAQAALTQTLDYVRDRQQFGKPLAANQAVQFRLADVAAKLNASRQVVRLAARELDAKNRCVDKLVRTLRSCRHPALNPTPFPPHLFFVSSIALPAVRLSCAPWPS